MNILVDRIGLATFSNEEMEAQDLVKSGKIDQAIAIYQRVKPNSGRIFHQLGLLYAEEKGDYHSAINYYQQALKIQEENGDDTSHTAGKLGFAYQNLGEFDLALSYHFHALRLRESVENVDQRSVVSSLLGLANGYWGQQDLSQALIYAQRALILNQSIKYDNDSCIAANLAILANIYHHSGDDIRALESAKQALVLLEYCSSSDSASLATLLNNIGAIQFSAGLFNDAFLTFIRVLHIYERTLSNDHPKRLIIQNNIQRIAKIRERNGMNFFPHLWNVLTKFSLL